LLLTTSTIGAVATSEMASNDLIGSNFLSGSDTPAFCMAMLMASAFSESSSV
jgi:hypothetical protein